MPSEVWEGIHSDVFEVEGVEYVLVIDEFSKFPFVKRLRGETSKELIEYLEDLFFDATENRRTYTQTMVETTHHRCSKIS
jgi:hypothetical protein